MPSTITYIQTKLLTFLLFLVRCLVRLTVLPVLVVESGHINPFRQFLCDRVEHHGCPVVEFADATGESVPVNSGFWEVSDWHIEAGMGQWRYRH